MTLTIFGCDADERDAFERYAMQHGVDVRCVRDALGAANARQVARGSAVCVDHKTAIDAQAIDALRMRDVRYLCTRSVGVDHIDREAALAAGVHVEGVAYSPESVAEHALLLMLMALRNAAAMVRRVDGGDFRLDAHRARELRDMTVGVVGTGRIGRAVAQRLAGFGCRVLAHDPHPTLPVPYVALDELLARCDIVTLHLPLCATTRHLIDRARIAGMKRDAVLVNTARGGLVDAEALADALEAGALGFAALDVVEGEEGVFYRAGLGREGAGEGVGEDAGKNARADANAGEGARADANAGEGAGADAGERAARDRAEGPSPLARLVSMPNVIVTPHTAFYTEHALHDIVRNTVRGAMMYGAGGRDAGEVRAAKGGRWHESA